MNLRHAIAGAALAALTVLPAIGFAQSGPAPAPAATPAPMPAAADQGATRGTNTSQIDKTDANQKERIQQGRQSGELTKKEAHKMKGEQKAVSHAQTKAAADGNVTSEERHHIRKMQDKASKDIHTQKHDTQEANPGAPLAK